MKRILILVILTTFLNSCGKNSNIINKYTGVTSYSYKMIDGTSAQGASDNATIIEYENTIHILDDSFKVDLKKNTRSKYKYVNILTKKNIINIEISFPTEEVKKLQ